MRHRAQQIEILLTVKLNLKQLFAIVQKFPRYSTIKITPMWGGTKFFYETILKEHMGRLRLTLKNEIKTT